MLNKLVARMVMWLVGAPVRVIACLRKWEAYVPAMILQNRKLTLLHLNQVGAIAVKGLIEGLILAFIGLMFLFQFIPEMEGEASTDNISNSFVAAMGDMAVWVIPVLGIVGVLYLGFNFIRSGRGKKG